MLYLICATISRVDHARYEEPMLKRWVHVSGDRVTIQHCVPLGINVICASGKSIRVTILAVEAT